MRSTSSSIPRRQLPLLLLLLLTLLLLLFPTSTQAIPSLSSSSMSFCKCTCTTSGLTNSTILPLYLPKDPLYPCLTCTRQYCVDQKLPSCLNAKIGEDDPDTGTGEEGDVEARCFQRDSPKSHALVVLFIIVTSALLAGAGLKRSGIDLGALWSRRGSVGEVFSELIQFVQSFFGGRRRRGGQYSSMST